MAKADVNFSRFDACFDALIPRCQLLLFDVCSMLLMALWPRLMSTSLASMSALRCLGQALMSTSLLPMSACDALWALMKQLMSALLRCLLATMQDETAPIAFGLLLLDVVVVLGMLLEICPG